MDSTDKPGDSVLICPRCGTGATIRSGKTQRRRNKAGDLPRTRFCANDHEVYTVERVRGLSTNDLLVRRLDYTSRGHRWHSDPFSSTHLGTRLHAQLFGLLELDECAAVAAAVEADISYQLATESDRHPKEANQALQGLPRFVGVLRQLKEDRRHYIRAEQVRDMVLERLFTLGRGPGGGGNSRFRAAHVIFALSTHGRITPERFPSDPDSLWVPPGLRRDQGWKRSSDFLTWLEKQYSDLPRHARVHDAGAGRGGERGWWRPSPGPVTVPSSVIKRHRKLRRRGIEPAFVDPRADAGEAVLRRTRDMDAERAVTEVRAAELFASARQLFEDLEQRQVPELMRPTLTGVPYEPYIDGKFLGAIRSTLAGRELHTETAENVRDWVLWSLVGQDVVLTSQLGAAVADCLRRLDDIAYLRWVIVAKELRVKAIHREASNLIDFPSPGLVFKPSSGTPARPLDDPSAR
jgi:transcriptional regulator NrdR family protein